MTNEAILADHARTIIPDGKYDNGGFAFGDDLYFISSTDGFCKIGRTGSIESRFRTLQNANPQRLTIELRLPGMGWQEKVWHAAFSHVRQTGEWFLCIPNLGQAINAAKSGKEWIATLRHPFRAGGDADDEWCNYIADLEDDALDAAIPPAFGLAA